MGFRYLIESSTLGFSENIHPSPENSSIEIKPVIYKQTSNTIYPKDFQEPAKFHIGMLTISLLAGLAYGGYVTYNCWREKNTFLSHIRNLVIALTCRTFFTILLEGVIILESPLDVKGGNTLKSFEYISLNLVVAFWLTLTIYIHARVQRNFNSEPTLKLYMFGVPGVAVYFALVEIFVMEGTNSSEVWWLIYYVIYFYQWIVNSLRLLYLLIQLALLIDIGRMMVVKSTDNDTVSLIRKVVLMMAILVLLFWLQFGVSVGRPPLTNPQPYLYFYYLVDGTQCVLVCIVSFFFNKWVPMILDKLSNIIMENGEMTGRLSRSNDEVLIRGNDNRAIVTIDSLSMKQASEKWTNAISDDRDDVVYSSVVQPQNLQKTLDLYKRLNVISSEKVTIIEGEQFYDCDLRNDLKRSESLLFQHIRNLESNKNPKLENKVSEKIVKKNAFYSSKYLIVDRKEKDIPKYLETRPCIFLTGKEDLKENISREPPTNLETLDVDELIKKWLTDHSENVGKAQGKGSQQAFNEKDKAKKKEEEILQSSSKLQKEQRPNVSETLELTVNSVIWESLTAPMRERSLNFEGNPEILNDDSDGFLENSDITEVHSRKNSLGSEINTSNYQFQDKAGFKETLDLRVDEKQNSQGDNIHLEEKIEGTMQKNVQNHFKSIENIQEDSEQKTVKQCYQIQNSAKDGNKREPKPDTILNIPSKSDCEGNLLESDLGETILSQKKKTLIPVKDSPNDIERRVTLKDEAKALPNRLEADTDTEIPPETSVESNLIDNAKLSDLKLQDGQSSSSSKNSTETNSENKKWKDAEGNSRPHDESEKENLGEKGSEFSLTSAIFSTISAAMNYGSDFFRSKNESTQPNYLTGKPVSEFF